jgi:hypothetical protein
MKRTSRLSTVALVAAVVVGVAAPAFAAWQITATNPTANAKATALGSVTGVATVVTSSSVTLTWVAPAGVPATGYTVTRTAPSSSTVCANVAVLTCTDTGLSESTAYTYSVVALRENWTAPAVATTATTSAGVVTRTFDVSVTGDGTAGSPLSVSLTARTNGVVDPTYTGSHTLTFSGASNSPFGDVPTASQAVSFVAGTGTATPTFYKAQTFTLTVSEASPARSGNTSVTVNSGAANRLRFTSADVRTGNAGTTYTAASCLPGGTVDVGNGGIFRSKVSVTDLYGNQVVNGASPVSVTISRSPSTHGTLSPTALTVAANANPAESGATFSYTHPTGNDGNTNAVVTATADGLTSVSCTIRKGA